MRRDDDGSTASGRRPLPLTDFATPIATIDRSAMRSNIVAMAKWCLDRGLFLAPHGKTTMAPAIWDEQLDAGAWAITVATTAQLMVARRARVPRVVIANEIIDPNGLRWLYAQLASDPEWQVICWVDSLAAVEIMSAHYDGSSRPIDVCVEVGALDARTGARTVETAIAVAEAARRSPALRLVGVAGYEGVITEAADSAALEDVRGYLRRVAQAFQLIAPLCEGDELLLSAGGSAYFDLVEEIFGPVRDAGARPTRVVLRPGVYVVHDDDLYARIAPHARDAGPDLTPAMHVWARVLSRPQPDLALVDMGRRDVSADVGLPLPQRALRAGRALPAAALTDAFVFDLNDQHAFLRLPVGSTLAVGDLVRFGVSHPCTTFDKWATILLLEGTDAADPRVVDVIRTEFSAKTVTAEGEADEI